MVWAWDRAVIWPSVFVDGGRQDGADATDISGVVRQFHMLDRVGAAKVVELDRVGATFARGLDEKKGCPRWVAPYASCAPGWASCPVWGIM